MSVVLEQKVCIHLIMLFSFLSLAWQRKDQTVIMPLLLITIAFEHQPVGHTVSLGAGITPPQVRCNEEVFGSDPSCPG